MSEDSQQPDFVMHPGEKTSLVFMQMVFQLSSLATMLLGKTPHPETGKPMRDLEAAQLVIDQLDMLEVKTKGNLGREEEQLLRQTLMSLRMAYVEAVRQPAPARESAAEKPESAAPSPAAENTAAPATEEESKKRFTKKY